MADESLIIVNLAGAWSSGISGYKKKVAGWARAALPKKHKHLSIVLADDAFIRDLNHQYRGKDKPTNVLSFAGEHEYLGDIVLGFETIKKEAQEYKRPFAAHTAHMVVHGVLHLLGYDHEKEKDATVMEKKEIAILSRLGIKDPYEVKHG